MSIGSIVSLGLNETNPRKVNFAIQQLLQRNGGQQVNSLVTITGNYTLKVSDFMVLINATATISLPAAKTAPGQIYCLKMIGSGLTGTVSPDGSDTIDGASSLTLTTQYDAVMIQSDGVSAWDVIVPKKTAVSGFLTSANNLSDLASASTARTNLGLGTAATGTLGIGANDVVQLDAGAKLPAVDGSQLTGISSTGRLIAGTALVLNPLSISTSASHAHGLGATPAQVVWYLECLTAEHGYGVGERIDLPSAMSSTVSYDGTNVYYTTQSVCQITDKTSHSNVNITAANWKAVVVPYKLS